MGFDLKRLLHESTRLPSLPAVAVEILDLARDGEADIKQLATVIEKDPAISAKLLRFANSPLFVRQQKIENLRRAIVIMGADAAISVALGFSLLASPDKKPGDGLDYLFLWRRLLLSAAVARLMGAELGEQAQEELFLAALLQDFGILVMDRFDPDFYSALGEEQYTHASLCAYERSRVGMDHAQIAARLMRHWNLAERTVVAVESSHAPEVVAAGSALGRFARCVGLSGEIADLLLEAGGADYEQVVDKVQRLLGLGREPLGQILARMQEQLPQLEALFDIDLLPAGYPSAILERANETLVARNLTRLESPESGESARELLEARAKALGEEMRRDALTGAFSRGFLESYLPDLFDRANRTHKPLSLLLVAVSNYREINSRFGSGAADLMLMDVARSIEQVANPGDMLVRYGGAVFVVVMPGASERDATAIGADIEKACSTLQRRFADGQIAAVNLSRGAVTHGDREQFAFAEELLATANSTLYSAVLQHPPGASPERRSRAALR